MRFRCSIPFDGFGKFEIPAERTVSETAKLLTKELESAKEFW